MPAQTFSSPRWSTATGLDSTDSMPMELEALGAHVNRCNVTRSRWFALRCRADSVHDFVAPRFVTTMVIAAAVVGIAALAL
jgi:hypothetical protein